MPAPIACICGYRGPAVTEAASDVCPICRTPAAPPAAPGPAVVPPAAAGPAPAAFAGPSAGVFPPADPFFGPGKGATASAVPAPAPTALRIPCPRGHVLDAPAAMLGQRVVCPKCNEFFVLDAENSVERLQQRERETAEREAREARRWLIRAIWVAVIVMTALVAMIFVSTLQK
jgi:hypothetical protein